MIHAYSLVHDDLPAMDDDDLRRGRPTCHKKFDEATAILVGDALLARAFEVLAEDIQPADRPPAAALCWPTLPAPRHLSAARRPIWPAMSPRPTSRRLEAIHRRKTGALIVASLQLGGITAGATPAQLAALEQFGRNLGLAFQITDDLLDVAGDPAAAGKRLAKDAARGKVTFPRFLGIEASRDRAAQLIDEACEGARIIRRGGRTASRTGPIRTRSNALTNIT